MPSKPPSRGVSLTLWLLWTLIIVAIVVPWRDIQDHTHWEKVGWIPFITPPVEWSDMIGNFVLYLPFGRLSVRALPRRPALTMVLALLLSGGTEFTQLYSHWRFPSMTDLVVNLSGAWCGIYFARRRSAALHQ